jgi:hypothetical protein
MLPKKRNLVRTYINIVTPRSCATFYYDGVFDASIDRDDDDIIPRAAADLGNGAGKICSVILYIMK